MGAKIFDGKALSKKILERVKERVSQLPRAPCLAIVLVGDDPASVVYTGKKAKACEEVGIESRNIKMPKSASEEEIISEVERLNNDGGVDGILVQLPLPSWIDGDKVLAKISLEKDVDGFHPENLGRTSLGFPSSVSCTPKGVLAILKDAGIELAGKHAVVIGRSRMVGKPLSMLLLNEDCTVTVCHSKTKNIGAFTKQADIVCMAAGKPKLLTGEMVKDGAAIIDIGTTKVDGKIVGDVDFDSAKEKASFITPVPGGVGPLTVAMLVENTLECYIKRTAGK